MLPGHMCACNVISINVYACQCNTFFYFRPAEFQCYTGLASVLAQIPCFILLVDIPVVQASMTMDLFLAMAMNGVFYHAQTFLAFILMSYISPVTHRWVVISTQQTPDTDPLLDQCWPSVVDGGPTLIQQWVIVSCLLGRLSLLIFFLS